MHSFSVIIPTRNRSSLLLESIKRLLALEYPPSHFEVIIVDNNSEDGSLLTAQKCTKKLPHFQVISEPNLGPSFARNAGIRHAKYNHLIFIDDDIIIDPDFLKIYDQAWSTHPNAHAIGGKITAVTDGNGVQSEAFRKSIRLHSWCYGQLDYGEDDIVLPLLFPLFSGNMSLRKDKGDETFFDGSLGCLLTKNRRLGAEDYELTQRLILQGKKVVYFPQITVKNQVDEDRVSGKYLGVRYFFGGIEVYLMEQILLEKFPQFSETYKREFFRSLRRLFKLKTDFFRNHLRTRFHLIFILSYFFVGHYFWHADVGD